MKEITTIIVALKSRKSFITSQATFSQSIILTEKYLKKKKKRRELLLQYKMILLSQLKKNKQPWGKNPAQQSLSIILLVVFYIESHL